MKFQKGRTPWNKNKKGLQTAWNKGLIGVQEGGFKGQKHTDEAKEKQRQAKLKNPVRYWLGKNRKGQWTLSDATKKRQSIAQTGHITTNETKEKVRQSVKKLWQNPEYRERIVKSRQLSKKNKGELHYNWQDGKSFEPYSIEFNNELKRFIKKRDSYTCQLCKVEEKDYSQKLSIHHIDYDKKNCNENNLITLCRACNSKANYKRNSWIKFFQQIIAVAETKRSNTKSDR